MTRRLPASAPSVRLAARSSDGSSRSGPRARWCAVPRKKKPSIMPATTSSIKATGTRSPTWRVADVGPDRRAQASVCVAPAGAVTRLGGGIAPALLVGLRGGCIGFIDRTEPGASRLRMAERAVQFPARAVRILATRHDFRHVDVRVEGVELRQLGLVRVGGDIH